NAAGRTCRESSQRNAIIPGVAATTTMARPPTAAAPHLPARRHTTRHPASSAQEPTTNGQLLMARRGVPVRLAANETDSGTTTPRTSGNHSALSQLLTLHLACRLPT